MDGHRMKRWTLAMVIIAVWMAAVPAQAEYGWVRIEPVGGEYAAREGIWRLPPGDLAFDVQLQYTSCDRIVLTVRDVELNTPEEGLVLIRETTSPQEFEPEAGLGRYWWMNRRYSLPAGLYEVRVEAFRGDYRFAVDVQYICP